MPAGQATKNASFSQSILHLNAVMVKFETCLTGCGSFMSWYLYIWKLYTVGVTQLLNCYISLYIYLLSPYISYKVTNKWYVLFIH